MKVRNTWKQKCLMLGTGAHYSRGRADVERIRCLLDVHVKVRVVAAQSPVFGWPPFGRNLEALGIADQPVAELRGQLQVDKQGVSRDFKSDVFFSRVTGMASSTTHPME